MSGPLVVIPTFNEASNIETVLAAVRSAVPTASILVVDDNSTDGTAELVRRCAEELPSSRVDVLHRPEKLGLGSAYVDGFSWGLEQGFDVIVQMDADFQHDPAAVPRLLGAIDAGADMAIGSRYVEGASVPKTFPLVRRALSRTANWYAQRMLRLPVRDTTAGFKAHRSALLEQLDLYSIRADGYGFQIETTHRANGLGARIVEIPIDFGARNAGASKMSWQIIAEAFLLVTRWSLAR